MLPAYQDIRDKLGEPIWFDDKGVPRYRSFHPDMMGVYVTFAALLEVKCQDCGQTFRVGQAISHSGAQQRDLDEVLPTPQGVGGFHFGDPPRHGCVGDTMNSLPVRVLQFWRKDGDTPQEWRRDRDCEVSWDEDGSVEAIFGSA